MAEIILYERRWAEEVLAARTLGAKPHETIGRLARYYYHSGYKKNEISGLLEDFMLRCDPSTNIIKWQSLIDSRAYNSDKFPLVDISHIDVTQAELEKISTLQGALMQRLMFTLLCLAKFGNEVSAKNNNWVNRESREIFSLANITITIKRQSLMINDLWRAGFVGYSNIVDNVNICVNIIDGDGTPILQISDFRNLGYQYMLHMGGRFVRCRNCGLTIKQTSNRRKYCDECAAEMNIQKTSENRKMTLLS